MKKVYYLLIAAMTLMCACNPEDKDPKGPSIINPDDIIVHGKETLEPDQQKVKLEQVATKMINLLPASEFEDVMDICAKVLGDGADSFEEGYDISELEGVWEDMEEDFFSYQEISDTETRIFLYLFLSNCTGTVEFGEHKATYKKGSETKVIYYEEDGTKWEAEITPKKLKQVYLGEWLDGYYDYDGYDTIWYKEYYNVTIEVPGSLSASIKRNGKTFAAASFSIDHNIGKDGIDFEKDYISLSCELQFDDMKFNVSKSMYNAKSGDIEFSASIYKGDIFVCSGRFSGNSTYDLAEDGDVLDWDAKGFEFSTNLLGEIQIKGNCKDAKKLSEYADSDIRSESELERIANNMNSLIEINVYYDGTSAKQAAIEMEPIVYDSDSYWIEPVIVFNDGSRYLFYEYFDEDEFAYLIQKFERMMENYANLVSSFEDILEY